MTYDPSKVAFVDIETTGLDPEYDAIWEIGVIVDNQPVVWQQLLTDREIDNVHPKAAEITGFHTRYDPSTALTPLRSITRLMSLVGDRHMVGACPWFDSERLHRLILRAGGGILPRELPWHYHLVDVENLAIGFLMARGDFEKVPFPWKSREIAKMLGVDQDKLREEWGQEHTALADAEFARRMFEAIVGPPEVEYR